MRGVGTPAGFALIELVTTLVFVGLMVSIVVPALKQSPTAQVRSSARQLMYDLDNARTAAMATRRRARMAFDSDDGTYVRYIAEDAGEQVKEMKKGREALQGRGFLHLPKDVTYGLGVAPRLPGDTASGAITFEGARLDFDERGVTMPFGTRGVIYLVHTRHPEAVAAVSVSGAASFRLWVYRNGAWR